MQVGNVPSGASPAAAGLRRSRAAVGLALAAALACAKPPPPAPPPACGDPGTRPRFDPASARCDCTLPPPALWQAAAPRGASEVVREKETVRLFLRRVGTADFTEKEIEAEVLTPNGGSASGVGTARPPEWALLQFPADFPLGTFHRAGIYTVLWRVDGGVVACDGFVIERRVVPEIVEGAGGGEE